MTSEREKEAAAAPAAATTVPVLLGLAVALTFVGFMLAATQARFVPQVADLYLVCQYARAMAEGHPFQYNPGEAPSTGATSLLHTSLLAGAHALGARGEGLIAFAIVTGGAFFLASIALAGRIGRLLGGPREAPLAGALVALGGPVVWSFLYGSDVALFMLLALWLLERMLAEWNGRGAGIAAVGTLIALARPEGLPLGLLLGAASRLRPAAARRGLGAVLAWLPAGAGVAVLALYRALTGSWLGTSVADKSLLANYSLPDTLALVSEYAVAVARGLLLGLYPPEAPVGLAKGWSAFFFPPLALVLVVLALVRPPEALRAPLRVWAAAVVLLFLIDAPNVFMGVHFNRYLMWSFPGLLALTAVGWGRATRMIAGQDPALERSLFRAGAAFFVVLGALSTLRFGALYGEMAGEIARRDVAMAEWISKNLPRGVAMANLATSVEYLTGHRAINLHGVTSPAFFGNRTAEREAGVFEALGRLPADQRPPYLITSASIQEGSALMRELVSGPPLYQSSSLSDELLVFPMRYDLVGRNGRMRLPESQEAVRGLAEVDRLNVCDSRDEAAHRYRYRSHLGNLLLHGAVRIDSYAGSAPELVADGGRAILGGESFLVRTRRGPDLLVVMRTAASAPAASMRASGSGIYGMEFPEAGLVVRAGGQVAARLAFRPRPGWDERVFRIPGGFLQDGATELALSGRYASFYYWFYQ